MIKLDLVIQGQMVEITNYIIDQYSKLSFVNNIILSSYDDGKYAKPNNVIFVNNELITPAGITNRNRQINTTRNGLKNVTSDFCVKMRADQFIELESMERMYNFWISHENFSSMNSSTKNPKGKIYVMGMYIKHVYHPRDHVYWGYTEDIETLFNIPYDSGPEIPDYNNFLRSEAYIGQFYYAKYNSKVYEHILNPREYIVDYAPKKMEALNVDYSMRDKLFKVFPRVKMSWPKYGLKEYHYDSCAFHETEYWDD